MTIRRYGHGGARPGSGRKRRVEGEVSDVNIHALVTPGEASRIAAAAAAAGIDRSSWLRAAIAAHLPSKQRR